MDSFKLKILVDWDFINIEDFLRPQWKIQDSWNLYILLTIGTQKLLFVEQMGAKKERKKFHKEIFKCLNCVAGFVAIVTGYPRPPCYKKDYRKGLCHCLFHRIQSFCQKINGKMKKECCAEIFEFVSCWWREKVCRRSRHCEKGRPRSKGFLHSKSQWTNNKSINYLNDVEPFATTFPKFILIFKLLAGMLSERS